MEEKVFQRIRYDCISPKTEPRFCVHHLMQLSGIIISHSVELLDRLEVETVLWMSKKNCFEGFIRSEFWSAFPFPSRFVQILRKTLITLRNDLYSFYRKFKIFDEN